MKVIKTTLICLLFCVAMLPAMAQTVLTGCVIDAKSNENLSFATVAVLNVDSSVVTGTVTGDAGKFSVDVPQQGRYLLSVSFIGYETYYQNVSLTGGAMNVGTIMLRPDATMLESVTVSAKAPVIEQQQDKLVMNVSQSAFAQGNNAIDLLRKAPGVSVDRDGNVLLNGQAVEVWIDGRPSHLDGKSLEALLRSTDGNSIDKIEIMANPSAKYDAQGQGGIINIKSKRSFAQGLNGTLSANLGGMGFHRELEGLALAQRNSFFWAQDVNLSLNYRTAKTNTFLQLSEQTDPMGVDVESATISPLFSQASASLYDAHTGSTTLKLGTDWFLNDKNTLGFIFSMPFSQMIQWADTQCNVSVQQVGGLTSQRVLTDASTEFATKQYMGNINYTHVFDATKMAELTANLDYMHNVQLSDNGIHNYYTFYAVNITAPPLYADHTTLHSDNIVDVYSAKVDWQRLLFGMFLMEAGGKWALSQTDNTLTHITGVQSVFSDDVTGNLSITPFDYNEHIGAAYATFAAMLPPSWTAKLGFRGEYTYAFNSDNTVRQNYFDLFPTAYVGYNSPDMKCRVGLSYTRRIQRPHYSQLNPFRNYIDAHTANEGNPNLKPCYSDNLYLTAGLGQHFTLYANYITMRDVISVTPQIDLVTGQQILRADNFGRNQLLGGGLTLAELPLGKAFSLMVNAGAYDFHSTSPYTRSLIAGFDDSPEPYDVHSFYASLYTCITWNMPKQWKLQLDGWGSTPVTSGYLRTDWMYMLNFGVKKTALDGRLILSLNVNDLLRSMNGSFTILTTQGVESYYNQQYLVQKVQLGLQWNFGTTQQATKRRHVGDLDEASRVGNNSAGITTGTSVGN